MWEDRYKRRGAVNLGFGWDRTENVLWRLRVGGELEGCASAKLGVLLIGANCDCSTSFSLSLLGLRDKQPRP